MKSFYKQDILDIPSKEALSQKRKESFRKNVIMEEDKRINLLKKEYSTATEIISILNNYGFTTGFYHTDPTTGLIFLSMTLLSQNKKGLIQALVMYNFDQVVLFYRRGRQTPETTSETIPETIPETTPETIPETTSETTSETTPLSIIGATQKTISKTKATSKISTKQSTQSKLKTITTNTQDTIMKRIHEKLQQRFQKKSQQTTQSAETNTQIDELFHIMNKNLIYDTFIAQTKNILHIENYLNYLDIKDVQNDAPDALCTVLAPSKTISIAAPIVVSKEMQEMPKTITIEPPAPQGQVADKDLFEKEINKKDTDKIVNNLPEAGFIISLEEFERRANNASSVFNIYKIPFLEDNGTCVFCLELTKDEFHLFPLEELIFELKL